MIGVARADDRRRDTGAGRAPSAWRPPRSTCGAARRSTCRMRSSAWNGGPAAEIVDDQLVLDQRAVRQLAGLRRTEPALGEEAAGQGAVAQQLHAALSGRAAPAVLGPAIEQRVLHLHAHQRHAGVEHRRVCSLSKLVPPRCAIRPSRRRSRERERGIDAARHAVVPPVELHEVEPLDLQPVERALDDAADVGRVDPGEVVVVGHALGVHLQRRCFGRVGARGAR